MGGIPDTSRPPSTLLCACVTVDQDEMCLMFAPAAGDEHLLDFGIWIIWGCVDYTSVVACVKVCPTSRSSQGNVVWHIDHTLEGCLSC